MIFQQLSIALGLISLIGFFTSSEKKKKISAFLLAISIFMGVFSFSFFKTSSSFPPASDSPRKQQQAIRMEREEESIEKEPIMPRTGNPVKLVKSGYYNIPPGSKRLCFSWLGDEEDGGSRVNQAVKINGVEFSARGSNCFSLSLQGKTYVEFMNPTQTATDAYLYYSNRKGGQGVHPFIEEMGN